MSYLSGFFSSQGDQETAESPLTRARAQQLGVQVPSPNSGLGRGARRSPSPNPQVGQRFFNNMAEATEIGELRRIAEMAIQALAQATAGQSRPMKPELPAFDRENIEIWIHRVTAVYERAGVTLPKDKFAHLESKFEVGLNPKINEFLYGPATTETWDAFLAYLREEYGATRRQQAAFMLQPLQRNGMCPSQILATMTEKTQKISIDDIRKEKIMAALPPDVQRSLVDKVENLTAAELATLADRYFDKDGQSLQPPSNPVNHVTYTAAFEQPAPEEDNVNAVRFKQGRSFPSRQGVAPKPKPKPSPHPDNSSSKTKALCWRHHKYGNKAKFCEGQGCPLFTPEMAKGQAGQRA